MEEYRKQYIKNRWIILLMVCLLGLLFSATPIVSANKLEQLNVEEGDAVWYDLTVSAAGAVGVNTWTDGTSEDDNVYLYLYDSTGKEVISGYGSYNKASITYATTTTGTFKVKVFLDDAFGGGTHKISVSSPLSLSASPHYKEIAIDIAEGDAMWYDLTVSAAGAVGLNTWTDGTSEDDNVYLYLYDPTGKEVTSGYGSYNKASITYATTTTGTFKVKVFLDDAFGGGTRKISVSSPFQLLTVTSASTPTSTAPIPTSTTIPTPTIIMPTPTTIPTPTKLGSGSILITSFPSGASIYLDGIYNGITPNKLTDLHQGSLTVTLKLEGYKDWQQSIDVTSGKTSYMPVALEPSASTILQSILIPEDKEKEKLLLEMVKKEISNFSKQDKEYLVNIHFQYANKDLGNGNYGEAKTYLLEAKAISEELKDRNLVEKAETLLEVVNAKIENKELVKLIYELVLALGAAIAFGYIFGLAFEEKMKKPLNKFLIIAVTSLILFSVFYILGHFL